MSDLMDDDKLAVANESPQAERDGNGDDRRSGAFNSSGDDQPRRAVIVAAHDAHTSHQNTFFSRVRDVDNVKTVLSVADTCSGRDSIKLGSGSARPACEYAYIKHRSPSAERGFLGKAWGVLENPHPSQSSPIASSKPSFPTAKHHTATHIGKHGGSNTESIRSRTAFNPAGETHSKSSTADASGTPRSKRKRGNAEDGERMPGEGADTGRQQPSPVPPASKQTKPTSSSSSAASTDTSRSAMAASTNSRKRDGQVQRAAHDATSEAKTSGTGTDKRRKSAKSKKRRKRQRRDAAGGEAMGRGTDEQEISPKPIPSTTADANAVLVNGTADVIGGTPPGQADEKELRSSSGLAATKKKARLPQIATDNASQPPTHQGSADSTADDASNIADSASNKSDGTGNGGEQDGGGNNGDDNKTVTSMLYTDNIAAACAAINETAQELDAQRQQQRLRQEQQQRDLLAARLLGAERYGSVGVGVEHNNQTPIGQHPLASLMGSPQLVSAMASSSSSPSLVQALNGAAAGYGSIPWTSGMDNLSQQLALHEMANGKGMHHDASFLSAASEVANRGQDESNVALRYQNLVLQQENRSLKQQVLVLQKRVLQMMEERDYIKAERRPADPPSEATVRSESNLFPASAPALALTSSPTSAGRQQVDEQQRAQHAQHAQQGQPADTAKYQHQHREQGHGQQHQLNLATILERFPNLASILSVANAPGHGLMKQSPHAAMKPSTNTTAPTEAMCMQRNLELLKASMSHSQQAMVGHQANSSFSVATAGLHQQQQQQPRLPAIDRLVSNSGLALERQLAEASTNPGNGSRNSNGHHQKEHGEDFSAALLAQLAAAQDTSGLLPSSTQTDCHTQEQALPQTNDEWSRLGLLLRQQRQRYDGEQSRGNATSIDNACGNPFVANASTTAGVTTAGTTQGSLTAAYDDDTKEDSAPVPASSLLLESAIRLAQTNSNSNGNFNPGMLQQHLKNEAATTASNAAAALPTLGQLQQIHQSQQQRRRSSLQLFQQLRAAQQRQSQL